MRNQKDQIWYHVDVNSAYLNWIVAYRIRILGEDLDLRDFPSVIGGSEAKRHGIMLAKPSPARGYGIRTGKTLVGVRCECPGLVIIPPDYSLYVSCSGVLVELLKEYFLYVHQYSVDGALCQVEGIIGLWETHIAFAHQLREEIRRELGSTVSIGVSDSKLLVEMASEFQKPDQVHTLFTWEIEREIWPLPVNELFWAGPTMVRKLKALGIRTIGALVTSDLELLERHLKKQGELTWNYANGRDVFPSLREPPQNRGYGNSTTTPSDVIDRETAEQVTLFLTETVCARLRTNNMEAVCVGISVIDRELRHGFGQTTLVSVTGTTLETYEAARGLFDHLWNHSPIRQMGIHTSKINLKGHYQCQLFDRGLHDKYTRLGAAVDEIRKRYEEDCVQRAVFVGNRIPYMSGDIDKVKRTGITKTMQRPGPGSGTGDRNHGSEEDRVFRQLLGEQPFILQNTLEK